MAEFDDERPDFDAVFRDPPDDAGRAARREARRKDGDTGPIDSDATGEVPRSRLTEGSELPPSSAAADPDDVPPPRPSRSRSSGSGSGSGSRSRSGGRVVLPAARGVAVGGGSRGGSGGGGIAVLQGPRGRLILGIAFAVVLVIVIALVVKDCQRSQLEDSYTSYINGVSQIATKSAAQGAALRQVMANPRGDKPPVLQAKINAIAKSAQGLVDQAEDLDPPGALKGAQASLVTALEYRVTGPHDPGLRPAHAAPGHRPADQGRRHRQAAAAHAGQRRHLRGLVQGPGDGGPAEGRHHRRRGAAAPGLPAQRRAGLGRGRQGADPRPLAAHHPERRRRVGQPARHLPRVHRSPSRRTRG